MKKLILKNCFSPGDLVLLTAAVRDLHLCYPNRFLTDVRTPFPALWQENPHITPLDETAKGVELLDCHYPLINSSNGVPYHAIHGFTDFLNQRLNLAIEPTAFKGDIHLSEDERSWDSQVAELAGEEIPFWIVVAGGKNDVTIKWWEAKRYQEVVDYFRGKIQFVQVGAAEHYHPKLSGVIDLRGKSDLRQLIRLVYHAQGVLCPVTLAMHLAAAVEVKTGVPKHRPCVVVAGGREPAHWEAYPQHQFIHTNGALLCCDNGGCWKSRVVPLGDGDERDRPGNLCVDVVGNLPRCMDMIASAEVVRRIETYFIGGAVEYLSPRQARAAQKAVARGEAANWSSDALEAEAFRLASEHFIKGIPLYDDCFEGRGIVICAGGPTYFTCAWVCIKMLRWLGCNLPVQLWHLGTKELDARMKRLVKPLNVTCIDAATVQRRHQTRLMHGWALKPYAILHSEFREVLLMDADNVPVVDPEFLFETPEFKKTGAIFWPDFGRLSRDRDVWALCGLPYKNEPEFESGQIVVDKQKCWKALCLTMWYNEHSDILYRHIHGDKDTFHMAFREVNKVYSMPGTPVLALERTMCQHDFAGRRIFQHRNGDKWTLARNYKVIWGFQHERECGRFLDELCLMWAGATKVRRYDSATKPQNVRAMADKLTCQVYRYVAGGCDNNRIQFLSDGRIGVGATERGKFWDLTLQANKLTLTISSEAHATGKLKLEDNGVWNGRWLSGTRIPVLLPPVGQEPVSASESAKHSGPSDHGPPRSRQFVLRAQIDGYSGYGLHACQIVTDLQHSGYEARVRALGINETFGPIATNVRHSFVNEEQQHQWELLLCPPGQPCTPGKRTIVFTMWECNRLRPEAVRLLNEAECIIVPSCWNASCFTACGVEKPIRAVPLGISTEIFHYRPMDMSGPCVFATAGRLESGGVRKGISQVIRLFRKAFAVECDVQLWVKVFPDCAVTDDTDERIRVTQTFLSPEDLALWFAGSTCFVSASKGEGWGLMQHQALAVGRPLISIRYGGLAEFFTDDMGYPINFRLVNASDFYAGCGTWAEPDEDHIIQSMREVYTDRARAEQLGKAAAVSVSKYSWSRSNQALLSVMQEFGMLE